MNSNSRNVWYTIGAIVLVIAVAWYVGFRVDSPVMGGLPSETGTSTVDGTDGSTNSNGTQGNSQPNGGTGTTAGAGTGASAVLSDAALNTIISNSLIRVPQGGTDVALTRGEASFKAGTKQAKVTVGSVLARLPTDDNTQDAIVSITYSVAGQTDEQYVAVFHVNGQNVRYTSMFKVGTGVAVRSVQAEKDAAVQVQNTPKFSSLLGYKLTIKYLGHKTGEPTSANPTVEQTVTAKVTNHVIGR
ncbi:MAG TPA: hypothetical protein VGE62_02555 [Candidatus Paceibacterota bacterium]